jgi:hypothetical protein
MGQPVQVREIASAAAPGVFQYETNRPLSGMGHRYFRGPQDAVRAEDPADVLARRLFERGGVDAVHVQGSVITVDVAKGHDTEGITEIIENLFRFYRPEE